ncbi:ribonuclease N1 [Longimycelium tulufanense]|uniref:Ribonuclease N1 n=1 Tax=Longimycelium tulufanense TaxID=907463 RepID=A0A8J3C8A2_9PSEU|nr:ribonuclease domain-containing protein [Longimycelium tulufanense]GGM53178.1 ribonuclease N1 [Longimycelium tulufanense]
MSSRRRVTAGLLGLIALVVVAWLVRDLGGTEPRSPHQDRPAATVTSTTPGAAEDVPGAESGLPVKPLSVLPAEAGRTWRLIERGGPFPYPDKDGSTFGNRERLLPAKERGYYREYTVPTPGDRTRGARRLVTGTAGEVYYTADHYVSFVVVDTRR